MNLIAEDGLKEYVEIDAIGQGIRPTHDHERHEGGGL